jgi:hypothetical protein
VRFAAGRLPVGKHCGVKAADDLAYELPGSALVDGCGGAVVVKDCVQRVGPGVAARASLADGVVLNLPVLPSLLFIVVKWPQAHVNAAWLGAGVGCRQEENRIAIPRLVSCLSQPSAKLQNGVPNIFCTRHVVSRTPTVLNWSRFLEQMRFR